MERLLTALVVDPSEPIRVLLTAFLSRSGFTVDSADGVDSALAKLRRRQFDVILLDPASSPDGDGISRVAAAFPTAISRTVVISSPPQAMIEEPVHAVIAKPFDLQRLLETAMTCSKADNLHRT